jgi:uncharacterized membrane protein YphA (DoxX/SURF4 family)
MMNGMWGTCRAWCHNKSIGLLLLRVALGSFFIAHGLTKFKNMDMIVRFFDSLGFHSPLWAKFVATGEVLSGVALILGAFLWPAALFITGLMLVAIWKVTSKVPGDGLINFINGWGREAIYASAALCIAWCGAGRWSLTAWWLRRKGLKMESCRECRAAHGIGHDCPDCPSGHIR